MSSKASRYKVVDLFCGAGGLSLGFSRAGFDLVCACDSWAAAVETYKANFDHHITRCEIAESLVLPRADVIIGGPPCQGFSSAGLRRHDDERNTLVTVFAKLISHLKPAAFLFENVEGFLTGAHGRFVFDLLDPLVEAGYRIHLRKVNAANFGVPQHRKRVIGIGGLGWDPSFPSPTHSAHGAPGAHLAGQVLPRTLCVSEALFGLPSAAPANGKMNGADHTYTPLNDGDLQRAIYLNPGQRMGDLPEHLWHDSYKRRAFRRVMDGTPCEKRGGPPAGLRRLRGDEPSKAITGASTGEFLHPDENRPLTVRECARLQTFPDTFKFIASRRDAAQLIGNAVPPKIAEVFAANLLHDLKQVRQTDGPGALLSFVPTLSEGMSPVLKDVVSRITRAFGPGNDVAKNEEQLSLWV